MQDFTFISNSKWTKWMKRYVFNLWNGCKPVHYSVLQFHMQTPKGKSLMTLSAILNYLNPIWALYLTTCSQAPSYKIPLHHYDTLLLAPKQTALMYFERRLFINKGETTIMIGKSKKKCKHYKLKLHWTDGKLLPDYIVSQWLVQSQIVSLEFFIDKNPSDLTMALGSTQPLTEMSTRGISWRQMRPVHKADNLTTILCCCQEIWEP
jgi:hypothetical protein